MTEHKGPVDSILEELQERAKELHCIYRVHEMCNRPEVTTDEILRELVDIVPSGFQSPPECLARITLESSVFERPGSVRTPWLLSSPIRVQGEEIGLLEVFYRTERPPADQGPFLKEERKLIDTIAERVGQLLLHRRLLSAVPGWTMAVEGFSTRPTGGWGVIIDFLRKTDQQLLMRVSRRMINYLAWNGFADAQDLLPRFTGTAGGGGEDISGNNRPLERRSIESVFEVTDQTFQIAARHLSPEEILTCLQKWIRDDSSGFLVEAVENQGTSLTEIAQALARYHETAIDDRDLSRNIQVALRVDLARRFLTDHLDFINIAKNFIGVDDFYDLSRRVICLPNSHGKIGGKGSGLFLAAQIVRRSDEYAEALRGIRMPKTWYVTSDGVLNFMEFNHLQDLSNRKYLEIDQVRREYPHIIQVFKNSRFSPEIVKGLALALDDFEERPLIVRSSSLLEDQLGHAFSGKYKSLFLANRGPKRERLAALMDAIAEVYASIFGPDPIEYRAEHGLLDVHEEMGIMIQEVVGTRVGKYFFPTYAGVAFSNNEFRWSPRIKREDGLVRLVPGLGTRAVDRVGDDYPILIAPGQPGLRVNVTADEMVRYSPRRMDVINLETRGFETVEIAEVLAAHGADVPGIHDAVSVADEGGVHRPLMIDWESPRTRVVVTFEGLVGATPFVTRMRALLRLLKEKTGGPVDIEFASDGKDLYLLQCRPQSFSEDVTSAPIPADVAPERVVFTANRYVSNGRVPDVTHVVYVDPAGYANLPDLPTLKRVGRAVGRLNKVLPKRQFILMGPGRWGSRGDVKLGVSVTYSDINNAAALIEIARKRGSYTPDLSFGTHFFQDLVESSIRYLPLFPDDPGVAFNEAFLTGSPNILGNVAGDFDDLSGVLRVIDVPATTGGLVLRLLMNADADRAIAYVGSPTSPEAAMERRRSAEPPAPEDHWRWRLRAAERIAAELDPVRFGVKALYLFGSTKNGTAGPRSDIDLLIHVEGDDRKRAELSLWLEGWSLSLAEQNYVKTGVRTEGLLDVHLLTDGDIARRTSYAAKIGAVTDPARLLPMKRPWAPPSSWRTGKV